jgi:hypothetical protein
MGTIATAALYIATSFLVVVFLIAGGTKLSNFHPDTYKFHENNYL